MDTSANYEQGRVTDDELVKLIPGFSNDFVEINGINLHYVKGGKGFPLILMAGWPETWWAYHKVLPMLAVNFSVHVVDIRGMGSSDKPLTGYDKKTIAHDIFTLTNRLGLGKVNIAGHDIGAAVAYSFAANFPDSANKVALLDTPPADQDIYRLPMMPIPGISLEKAGNGPAYPWWLAFNQVKGLPERLLEGRMDILLDWLYQYLLIDAHSVDNFDRAVYVAAYNNVDSIRAANGWYQAFTQDIEDIKKYKKIEMPVLGIGGSGYEMLVQAVPNLANDFKLVKIEHSGHFILAEKPMDVAEALTEFFM